MNLYDSIEEDIKLLNGGDPDGTSHEKIDLKDDQEIAPVETPDEAPEEKETPEEPTDETPSDQPEEPKPEEDIKPDAAAFAKMRREARELKAKIAAMEQKKPEAVAAPEAKQAKPEEAPEPNKEENYQAWLEFKLAKEEAEKAEIRKKLDELDGKFQKTEEQRQAEQIVASAADEFRSIEESYREQNADYGNAADFARGRYAESIRVLFPQKTAREVEAEIDRQILLFAADCAQKGLNPAEEIYDMAIERFGYKKEAPAAPSAPKPDLKAISASKKRSATPLGTGGQGGGIPLTLEMVSNMTVGEYNALTPAQLRQLEGGLT